MNRISLYIGLLFLIVLSCDKDEISPKQEETFIKYYGGNTTDKCTDVKQLPGGGYFVIGTIEVSENNTDIFVFITDKSGNSKSNVKTIGGPYNDKASRLQILPDGGAVVAGTYQNSVSNKDIWIIRFDNIGDVIWSKKYGKDYGDDEGEDIIINNDDNIVAVGYTDSLLSTGIHNKQIWMHCISTDGNIVWPYERIHGAKELDEKGNSVIELADGSYIVAGTSNFVPAETNRKSIYLMKVDDVALHGISITISDTIDLYGTMVKPLPDDNLIILGNAVNSVTGSTDIVLSKTNTNLNKLFSAKILDDGENETSNVIMVRDNQLFILGTTYDTKTNTKKMLLINTDSEGDNPVFHKYGYTKETIEGIGMDFTSDGGFIFAGSNMLLYKIKNLEAF